MDWIYYEEPVYNYDARTFVVAYRTETSTVDGVYTITTSYLLRGEIRDIEVEGVLVYDNLSE